jgi:tetratricopeptide (TPR) repeat protein
MLNPSFRATCIALLAVATVVFVTPPGQSRASGEIEAERAKQAAAALQRNDAEKAISLYTEALADQSLPNDRRAALHNDRGVAYSRLNKVRSAVEDFNRAVQLFPENASAYNNRGNVLLGAGLPEEAIKDFDRALALAPGYAAAYSNRANAHAELGRMDAAIRDFAQASRLAPNSPAPLAGRGRVHLAASRPHTALRDLDRAIKTDDRFGPGYRARADVKLAIGRFEEAVEDLSRAVAFDPTNFDLYLMRGHAYLAAQNAESAMRDFARATELDPRSAAAQEGIALVHTSTESFDDALNALGRALELDPRSASAHAYRAIVYKRMGQANLGQTDLDRAVRLDADRAEVAWARGELAEASDLKDRAIAEFRTALALKPYLRDAAVGLERLGASATDAMEVRELAFDRWTVFIRNRQHHATHPDLGRLQVPLEVMGDGPPKLLDWDVRKAPNAGIGVLRFSAGQMEGTSGNEAVEHAAVIDMTQRSLIAVEVVRQGSRDAKWNWEDNRLIIDGVDGVQSIYQLRQPKEVVQQPVEQRRRVSSGGPAPKYGGGTPAWAPWAQNYGTQPPPTDQRRRPPQQPKTLFDLIFKN